MSVLVLGAREVESLLDMEGCITAMSDVLASLARGELFQPLRQMLQPPHAGTLFGLMPAHRGGGAPLYALKEIVIAPDNPARGMDSHQGSVLLHDGRTGELVALLNASPITAIRTAAVSAVATRALARGNSHRVAILGAGVQARAHVESMRAVLDDPEIRIWSRTAVHAEALATEVGAAAAASVQEALEDADVVCTVTTSREPIIRREWLRDGVHVNAVGSSSPTARELDSATVAAAILFVDRRESINAESGDYLIPLREGAIGADHIAAELGEVLVRQHAGRTGNDEITLFKSLGIGVEDLAAAELVLRRARIGGVGHEVDF